MNNNARTDWLEEARFGLFIHFGLYSMPAGVWNGQRMGRNDYAKWTGTTLGQRHPILSSVLPVSDRSGTGGSSGRP
jgi:hypothetical protein